MLIHAKTWINLKNVINEEPVTEDTRADKSNETVFVVCLGWWSY